MESHISLCLPLPLEICIPTVVSDDADEGGCIHVGSSLVSFAEPYWLWALSRILWCLRYLAPRRYLWSLPLQQRFRQAPCCSPITSACRWQLLVFRLRLHECSDELDGLSELRRSWIRRYDGIFPEYLLPSRTHPDLQDVRLVGVD